MHKWVNNTIRIMVVALAVFAVAACASSSPPILEHYSANAVSLQRGANSVVYFGITRWSTEQERAALGSALERGQPALVDALYKTEDVGFVRISGRLSYRLKYARVVEEDGKRIIILGCDRPIGMREQWHNTRSTDYDVSIIKLEVDSEGNGSGSAAIGVELSFDKEKNLLVVKNYGIEPVRLMNVRKVD